MARDLTKEESTFRRWLLNKIKQSRWAQMPDESVEQIAARLLLHPDALRIAQRELTEQLKRRGRAPRKIGTGAPLASYKMLELAFPKDIYADWKQYCELRGLPPATVLRSMIHGVLSGERNPKWLGRGWYYRGRRRKMDGFTGRYRKIKWPHTARTEITQGAFRALAERANNSGCTWTALVRGQVAELLEGKLHHYEVIGTPSQMWDDETRYVTTAKVTR